MELDELLPAFAARLGIEGLAGRDGACSLEIDGIPVEIAQVPDGAALAVCAVLGKPPPEKEEIFLETLLEATIHFHSRDDMAFGLLSDTGDLVLQWRTPTAGLDLDAFCAQLETFLNRADQWRRTLEDFRPAAEAAVLQEESATPSLGTSGFLSV
jgi:hypothetical protein